MPKTVKGGALIFFKHPFCCKISKKVKGDTFESLKVFEKMINFKSLIVPENLEKREPLGFFNIRLLQNIKQIEGRTLFGDIKKISKKSHKAEKGGGSLIVPKK